MWLALHGGFDLLSMTGSFGTGRKSMAGATATVKPATLELGGKSPLIVLDDVDIRQAAVIAAQGNFLSNDEICGKTTRVVVPTRLAGAVLDALLPNVAGIRIGDPMQSKTRMGALISHAHRERFHTYVHAVCSDGADLVSGGAVSSVQGLSEGAFYRPRVLAGCHDGMAAVRKRSLAHRVAHRLQVGTVWINTVVDLPAGFGYGGSNQSGIGYDNGLRTLDGHLRVKGIYTGTFALLNPFL